MPHFPFQRLQADLAALISQQPAGERLPSEPDLAKQLGVSRATLREAMRTFEAQGLIRRRQGAGTFVVGQVPVIEAGLEALTSIQTLARQTGLDVTVASLTIETVAASGEVAEALNLAEGAPVVSVARVIRTDLRPVAYLIDILPVDVIHPTDLQTRFDGSVLDYLLGRGDPLTISRADVGALGAPPDVAKMLEIQRGDVLLEFVAKLYTASGQVVDYSFSYFIPGYFKFHVVRKVA
jgi:GntR family transcriptional regulator